MNKQEAQKIAHDIATLRAEKYFYSGLYCNFTPISVGSAAYCAAFDSLCKNDSIGRAIVAAVDAIVNDIHCYCTSCYQPYEEFNIGKRDY